MVNTRLPTPRTPSFLLWLKTLCCAALVSWTTLAAAANMHDHGQTGTQAHSASGPIKEIALPDGLDSAQSITMDAAGRVWFTEKVGKKLAMYDPDKKEFASHSLPVSWGSVGFSNITSSPDGEIWFTVTRWAEGAKDPYLLGRFTPTDGYFTKYALPGKPIPLDLAIDTEGLIWFLASNKNFLYRIDPTTFALKGYPLPASSSFPKNLAAAPDGHIWLSLPSSNKLCEFNPDEKTFREHEVPTAFANPGKISIGKDGKIWFVEVTANRIGAFSPDQNRFDEIIVPSPNSSPVTLTSDGKGNIWFLEYKGNKVGAFNPETADIREFDIPTYSSLPAEMVMDSKRGVIWFTQSATESKKLGMLSINEALSSPRQDNVPRSTSDEINARESKTNWPTILAVIACITVLGGWLLKRQRKHGRTT